MRRAQQTQGGRCPETTPSLDSLHHVAIQVQDIRRAVRWYSTLFETAVDYQDESWALLRFRNIALALVVPGQHPPHIAVINEHAADFGPLVRHRDGSESVYIEDSEGNSVEIMKPFPATGGPAS